MVGEGGGVEWSDGGRGREGGGCGVKGEWCSHIIPSLLLVGGRLRTWSDHFHTWAVSFIGGQPFLYQAVVGGLSLYLDGHLRTWAVGDRPRGRCLGCPRGGDGYAGCRYAMVACWRYCCHIAVAPAFSVNERRATGHDNRPTLHTVTMACIITVWTTWYLATSSPTCSIARRMVSRWGW